MEVASNSLSLFGQRQISELELHASLVDEETRRTTERVDQDLVVITERLAVKPIAQVQVPEDLTLLKPDRHAEEGAHDGVIGRKTGPVGISRDVLDPTWRGVVDHVAQEPLADRGAPDGLSSMLVEADRDERVELISGRREDPEGAVASPHESDGLLDDG